MSSAADSLTRRALLGRAALVAVGGSPLATRLSGQQSQQPIAGQGDAGSLRDPRAVGRSRGVTGAGDNDATIQTIERQLKCTCGCNLDIFTCRTTDFTCTYSPELHKEVVALHQGGRTPQEVIDAFVARYGERVLMAPKPVDFNLVGYLLPGSAILAGGAALAWVIGRRTRGRRAGAPSADRSAPAAPEASTAAAPPPAPTPEELRRLEQELAQVED
jgi:cytochrome c-type biogenesis protein CcmH/NrfF